MYRSTPLYDRQSLPALEEDVRTVVCERFTSDLRETVGKTVRIILLEADRKSGAIPRQLQRELRRRERRR
ncbi:hypothetical protein DMJ13_11065 [halophilic archaeon]|nr:hypothetical protein DMJ13_11065 [halophilic archaeon]